jgi:tripartite-type tricarboxylate transporter receptor subunit TctC
MNYLSSASRRSVLFHLMAAGLAATGTAHAQVGGRPVRLLVPTSAGSSADIGARLVGERVQKALGRPVIVENKAGAGGSLAALAVAGAEPNGETIGVLGNAYLLFPVEYPQQKFDPLQDVIPVAMISRGANVVLVASNTPFTKLDDVMRRARAMPGRITYGAGSNGSSTSLAAERLRAAAKVDLIHVAYKGSPEIVQELIAGRIDFGVVPVPVAAPFVKSGHVRALAVSSSHRSALLPETPTTVEAGFAGSTYDTWIAALVPAKTPLAKQQELNKVFNAALQDPELQQRFAALGVKADPMPLKELQAFVRKEYATETALANAAKGR